MSESNQSRSVMLGVSVLVIAIIAAVLFRVAHSQIPEVPAHPPAGAAANHATTPSPIAPKLPTGSPPTAAGISKSTESTSWPSYHGTPDLAGVADPIFGTLVKRWTWEAGSAVDASVAIADGSVFVATTQGVLARLDLATGAVRWRIESPSPFFTTPLVMDGSVFLGDEEGKVRSFAADTGKVRWEKDVGDPVKASATPAPNSLLIGTDAFTLLRLAADDGHALWTFTAENYIRATPCLLDGMVCIAGCDGRIRTIALADGQQLAAATPPRENHFGAAPVGCDGCVYVGSYEGDLMAVHLIDGAMRWHRRGDMGKITACAAVNASSVVFAGDNGGIACVDPATGTDRWRIKVDGSVESSPVIAGDRVYIGANDGVLRALDLTTGAERWRFAAGAPIKAGPAIAGGWLVMSAGDGAVYAFQGDQH